MKNTRSPKSQIQAKGSRDKQEFAPHAVLVPVDFSALSDAALERGKQIARQFGSKLCLFHAVEPIIYPIEYAIVPPEMEEVNMRQMSAGKTRLEAIKKKLDGEAMECTADVKLGKPWRLIVDFAKRSKCDLIVIATHGRTGPKHWFIGSTAERVVQHAPCSVLVVR